MIVEMNANRSLSALEGHAVSSILSKQLERYGLDIVAPLQLSAYNADIAARNAQSDDPTQAIAQPLCAPGMSVADITGENLTVLIGNSRNMWRPFISSLRKGTSDAESTLDEVIIDIDKVSRPLDTYVIRCVEQALHRTRRETLNDLAHHHHQTNSSAAPLLQWRCYWSHVVDKGETVAIQRMAEIANVAALCPTSHLSLHPQYGPWIAWRAAVVFNIPFRAASSKGEEQQYRARENGSMHEAVGSSPDVQKEMDAAMNNASDWR